VSLPEPAVALSGVRFGFGPVPILDGIDLSLVPGDFVVLSGPNGSGKSTLLRLCVGLVRPQVGTVRVLGVDPGDRAVLRRIGYAPQVARPAGSLPVSVSEVVGAGLAPGKGLARRFDRRDWGRVNAALESVGLGDLSQECLFELSGGQQQRAVLARALVSDPPLLLLDEPTTGIDQRLRPAFVRELERRAKTGTTIVVVSHDPDDFHEVVERILVIDDGRLRSLTHGEFHAHLSVPAPSAEKV
jgi:zinc transport system ATP-binding protein